MGQIKITPDELEAVSKQFKSGRGQSEQIVKSLEQKINGLKAQWEGASQTRFSTNFDAAKKSMDNYLRLLDDIATELSRIAVKFRQTDQSN